MDHSHQSTIELLERVLGNRAAKRLYRGALEPLFVPHVEQSRSHMKLAAAHELIKRWMAEGLHNAVQLTSPQMVTEFLRVYFAGKEHESFVTLFLNTHNRLIGVEEMFRGTLTQTSVYPREIVKRALQLNAAAVIFAHNHPSGPVKPSAADTQLTNHLKTALGMVDIVVLDHIVIGSGGNVLSFAVQGLL